MARTKAGPKPKNDAYTLLLFVTLVAIGVGCVLLHLDFQEYGEASPPATPAIAIPKLGDVNAPLPKAETVPKPEPKADTPADPAATPPAPAPADPAAPAPAPAAPPATPNP